MNPPHARFRTASPFPLLSHAGLRPRRRGARSIFQPIALLAILAMTIPTTVVGQDFKLTLERILTRPGLSGTSPSSPAWSPTGSELAFLWNDAAGPRREIWSVRADGSGLRRMTLETEGDGGVRQFVWTPDGKELVYLRGGDLWRVAVAGGGGEQLTDTGGGKSDLAISPDGRFASFLQAGDLWLLELQSNVLTRGTTVGVPSISSNGLGTYARPDVEIGPYVWGGPTYHWSPDSRTIAVHYVDRRNVRIVPFPTYLEKETANNNLRRGSPGDPNEFRTVGWFDVASRQLTLLDLPEPTANRVVDFNWSPRGTLLIDCESDTTEDRWLYTAEPAASELRPIWHDHRPSRVYTSIGSAWHPDGERVIFLSDLGDRYGLYLLQPGEAEPQLLTNAASDVTAPPVIVPDAQTIFYQSNEPNPAETHVFRIPVGGGAATRVSSLPGTNQPFPAPDGRRVAMLHSDDVTPPELYLVSANGGTAQRITTSPSADFSRVRWARPRYATFPSRIDPHTLHARIIEPVDLDRTKKYPVVFGPVYSNTVRNRWGNSNAGLQQLLVERGYIVVQVDVRGSTGYGREFREDFLLDFAGKDLEDLQSAVEYLATLPYVDTQRIGIWGSSYGGTLTIYSLLKKPGLFRAGVAAAAAVDPYQFGSDDVAITRRPQTHPAAFTRGAAQFAGNLQDHLLIIHGMQDDVVPFRSMVVLAEELMRHGKDFDFAFAPAATHGWTAQPHYARYLMGKLLAHFDRYLQERLPEAGR